MIGGRQIVYLIGAGLSKSLEKLGKRIPLMYDFVQAMADHADKEAIFLTTLAQLEKAKVFEHECSECAELARKVLRGNATSETKRAFKKAFMNRRAESIEQLLANALAKGTGAEGPSATELVIRFNYAINRFFFLLNWQVDWDPLERFLHHQFRLYPPASNQHTFVTFNYDLILDHAIQAAAGENWNPFTGYGFSVRRYWERGKDRVAELPAGFEPPPSDRIRILKPHGSLNWLVPQAKTGQTGDIGYLLEDGPVCVPLAEHGEVTYSDVIEPKAVFPTILAVCIIPPTDPAKRVNLGFIEKTRCLERRAIESAGEVYVLGWSMPVTDQDQICTIRCCMAEREKPLESITVINRGERPEYFQRIADTLGVTRSALRIFNNGFSDYVQHCTR